MGTSHAATSTRTSRARDFVLMASGRASAANAAFVSALDLLDSARAGGDLVMSDLARERLSRLMLEVSAKTNEFRRELEELIGEQR